MNIKYTSTTLKESLNNVDYAVFDFDGTVYPNMFLFDLSSTIFAKKRKVEIRDKKICELNQIAELYKAGKFEIAYIKFIKLLKGERKEDLQKISNTLINNSYKYAVLSVKKLNKKYGIKSYLISLTADFVAEVAQRRFNFEKTFSIKYDCEKYKNWEILNGTTPRKINNPQVMKKNMLIELRRIEGLSRKFICFFDSSDDLPIANSAVLRIGVNPKPDLSKYTKFDLVLSNKTDPWEKFYYLISSQ